MTTDIDMVFVAVHLMQLRPLASSTTEATKCGEIGQLPCHPARSSPRAAEGPSLLPAVQPRLQHSCRVAGFSLAFDTGYRSNIRVLSI